MNLLYSLHDRDAHPLIPAGGWCVESIALAENPQPQNWTQIRGDINWILRLNYAHNGRDGTIPLRGQYAEFAKRCTDYMANTKGCTVVVIANEPNHAQEYPNGVPISPEDYAECFNLCFRAITHERPDVEVCTAAVAPWDITSGIDWLAYYKRMLAGVIECDGLAVHGYSHGADPNLIWSLDKTHGWYWHFPVIYQTIQAIPSEFATRPIHVTETDQGDHAWADRNSGWVQNAYKSVNDHNNTPGTQKICSLALYRWRGDKYAIHDKNGVQDDFRAAVAHGYRSPIADIGTLPPEPPRPTPAPPTSEPAREIDQRLIARGVRLEPADVDEGTGYWMARRVIWLDRAADQIGPDHHILGETMRDDRIAADVPLLVTWPSGSTTVVSKRVSYNDAYNYDYGMGPSLNEYSIRVHDGNPSDVVSGIGMGKDGNPREHTSTLIDWQWTISEGVTAPIPPTPTPAGDLTHPLPGAVVTQHWGQDAPAYGPGIWGHDGVDLAGLPEGQPVYSMAAGKVAFTGFDEGGYGNYVRCEMEEYDAYAFYAHLQKINVQVGQLLKVGDVIGLLGTTGNSSGPHLHLEIRMKNPDGSYCKDTPMRAGRVDPETFCFMSGLKL